MFNYARADTHFLLYVFDNMRNELVEKSDFSNPEKDKVTDVLNKSCETALQRYEHPIYDTELGLGPVGWYKLLTRTPVQYTPQQFSVFRAVHKWRDDVARVEDESPLFVMPNHAVFSIARALPDDKAALFNVTQHVSHILRVRADELVAVINEAKAVGADAPDLNETIKKIDDLRFGDGERPRATKTATVATQTAAAQTAPTPAPTSAPISATLATPPPLRAPQSSFWGSLWSGRGAEQRRPASTMSVSLALPLPPLTAEVFVASTGFASVDNTPQPKSEHTFVPKADRPPEDERSDIFVVKQLGGKRKRTHAETIEQQGSPSKTGDTADNIQAGDDEVMLDEEDPYAQRRREKQIRKEEKARKKEQKRQQTLASSGGLNYDGEDEPAFDYASAPSVLRARDAERSRDKSNGKQKKDRKKSNAFNPYGNMADAPKGLPRAQKERAGRSKTFKS